MEGNGCANRFDPDKITETLAPEDSGVGGLLVLGKDRMVFRSQRKSALGQTNELVYLEWVRHVGSAKRMESKVDGSFKVPKERGATVVASLDEGDKMHVSVGIDEVENDTLVIHRVNSNRRYRESASTESSHSAGSVVTEEANTIEASFRHHSDKHMKVPTASDRSSRVGVLV